MRARARARVVGRVHDPAEVGAGALERGAELVDHGGQGLSFTELTVVSRSVSSWAVSIGVSTTTRNETAYCSSPAGSRAAEIDGVSPSAPDGCRVRRVQDWDTVHRAVRGRRQRQRQERDRRGHRDARPDPRQRRPLRLAPRRGERGHRADARRPRLRDDPHRRRRRDLHGRRHRRRERGAPARRCRSPLRPAPARHRQLARLGARGEQVGRAAAAGAASPADLAAAPRRRRQPLAPPRRGRGDALALLRLRHRCGDAPRLRPVKSLLARGPLKRLAPGPLSYAIAATTRTLPSYVVRRRRTAASSTRAATPYRIGEQGRDARRADPRRARSSTRGPAKIAVVGDHPLLRLRLPLLPLRRRPAGPDAAPHLEDHAARVRREFRRDLARRVRGSRDDVRLLRRRRDHRDGPADELPDRRRRARRAIARVRVRLTEPIRIVDFYAPPRG